MRVPRALHALLLGVTLLLTAAAPAPAPRDSSGFLLAVPPYTYSFPRDHASHPGFRTEWWYYTGHLSNGRRDFGYELTFFRVGLPGAGQPGLRPSSRSAWRARDVMFVHLALTDEKGGKFRFHDAARRPALGVAGADSARYSVWLEQSFARLAPDGRTHELRGVAGDFEFALTLDEGKPPVAHGVGGVSQKSAGVGNASHYYSLTRMPTRGRLRIGDDTLAVSGTSWMDHEFGSGAMSETHSGWDWFSIQLGDGRELMLYQLRLKNGGVEPLSSGTLVEADGRSRHLPRSAFGIKPTGTWKSPRTAAVYPSGWQVELPGEGLSLTITPSVADQELTATGMGGVVYWEGSVRVSGRSRGAAVTGKGYVELTGYTGRAPF